MAKLDPDSNISVLSGVSSKRAETLSDHNIDSVRDLLYYFPRRHLDRTTNTLIKDIVRGRSYSIIGQVETFGERPIRRG